ncbi:hypothetical protein H0H81_002977, partial [Sphagnurus paluster]
AFAVLNVEQGDADFLSCSEGEKNKMGQDFLENACSWLDKAAADGVVPAQFPVERLILVTGFYKTWNWSAMALSSDSSTGGLGFSVKATGLADGSLSYNWNEVHQVTPARSSGHHHPSRTESVVSPTVLTPWTSELFARCCRGHHDARNQCIFLRGFRYRERVVLKDKFKERAAPNWKPSFRSGPPVVPAKANSASEQETLSAYVEPIDGLPNPDAC